MGAHHLYESVPNFSEGTRTEVIAGLAGAAAHAHVIDVDADADHNRVVSSLVGHEPHVVKALLACAQVAMERIDLREHRGVHPRVGTADVLPIVPLEGASLADAHEVARALGERIWTELNVPVYFYGHGEVNTLADIRAGRARPALGGPEPHTSAGAVCVGARHPLLSFNIILPGMEPRDARGLPCSLRVSARGHPGGPAPQLQLNKRHMQARRNH